MVRRGGGSSLRRGWGMDLTASRRLRKLEKRASAPRRKPGKGGGKMSKAASRVVSKRAGKGSKGGRGGKLGSPFA